MINSLHNFPNQQLPKKQVFGYLMGMIPLTLFAGFFGLAYAKFFLHDLKMEPIFWFIGLTIYAAVNMFNDPLLGNMSDNTDVARWGSRRIIYIKYGAPFITLAFLAIWWLPTNHGNQFLLFLHFIITICAYETFFTMVTMCWYALLPELTTDVDQRTAINLIGTVIILFFGLPILMVSTLSHQEIKDWSLFIAAIGFVSYLFVVILSKERPEFQQEEAVPLKEAVKLTWKSKAYRIFIGYNFMGMLSGSINSSFLFMFWFLLGEENIGLYFLIIIFAGYGSNILCMSLRKKFGMVTLITSFRTLQIIGGIATFIFSLFLDTDYLIWIGLTWITFFGGAGVFTYVLQTIPIDEDELKTGKRREGMFFGINALFTMPANSIGPMIGTAVMLAFGYVQGAPAVDQAPGVFTGIKALFFLLPAIFGFLGLLIVRKYPLDGKKLEEMLEKLEILHQHKKETFNTGKESAPVLPTK